MKLALLSLVGWSLWGQSATAVYTDFNPTVKRVTLGASQCTFWFKASAYPPYSGEVVCTQPGKPSLVLVSPMQPLGSGVVFPEGTIGWMWKPNALDPTRIDYQITAQGSGDAVPLLKIGTV